MAQLKGVSGGTLNVAVISAGDYFFPRLLAEFIRRHPGVTLNLAVHNREELLHQMADNLTDLAVMVRPPRGMDTVSESFAPHPYVIVARARTTRSRGAGGSRSRALARESFVVREKGSDTWNSMEQAFGRRLAKLNIAMEITQHRNDQAGGHRGHGHQLPVGAHDQHGAAREQPGRARRAGLSADAELVRRASREQAAAAGRACVQALPAWTRARR